MRTQIGLLSVVGFFGLLATADAQTQSASTGTAFDGTYHFVTGASVNPTYTSSKGDTAPCPYRTPGPLTIASGQARYNTETGYELVGTVTRRRCTTSLQRGTGLARDGFLRQHESGARPLARAWLSSRFDFTPLSLYQRSITPQPRCGRPSAVRLEASAGLLTN
jgi:hypothetical protein